MPDPWYKDAFIYAIDISKFADSDGDGWGDIPGLISRLDYLERLGVTCLWLLPFYESPRKDNGYDVTDHYRIDPRLGTLEDFSTLVRRAGERGIRIVIDIVMDHSSDEHPWFQAARRDRKSRFRRYYTWTEMPPAGGLGHGSAFPGEESSLWKYDEMAGQYYYHPFYRFQPQLNMSEPEIRNELTRVLDFWLSFGVSGFRLDAVPLMLGLDGPAINVASDPHSILREARAMSEERVGDALLLGEVDLSAGKLIGYFGDGDELNGLLNFQLNNYLFLAFAREKSSPVVRGLRLLPLPPPNGQWINFLRNYDELNIQWLPEEDRHYVWDEYAPDPDMRIYGRGIRRRLAPMLDNHDKLEMALSLLFALPGTPMLVFGDEIGLGENLSIPGRDAARTPMQWSPGKNGGFSSADPEHLAAPVNWSGDYSYEKINVLDQLGNPDSTLEAVRRFAAARKEMVEIGRGGWAMLGNTCPNVLVYQCVWRSVTSLFVFNLSGEEQSDIVDLSDHRGEQLVPVISKVESLEQYQTKRFRITLPPYGYAWYRLQDVPGSE